MARMYVCDREFMLKRRAEEASRSTHLITTVNGYKENDFISEGFGQNDWIYDVEYMSPCDLPNYLNINSALYVHNSILESAFLYLAFRSTRYRY